MFSLLFVSLFFFQYHTLFSGFPKFSVLKTVTSRPGLSFGRIMLRFAVLLLNSELQSVGYSFIHSLKHH